MTEGESDTAGTFSRKESLGSVGRGCSRACEWLSAPDVRALSFPSVSSSNEVTS